MNIRRGFVGLFILTFLLSGIGLGLLVLDDQNDLSSRASLGNLNNLRPALPGESALVSENFWDGTRAGLPIQVAYQRLLWSPPTARDSIFFHLVSPISARFIKEEPDLIRLSALLGPDFTAPKLAESTDKFLPGWRTTTYSFQFFGDSKIVDVWSNGSGLSLIAVMSDSVDRPEVISLLRGVKTVGLVKGISTPDDSARQAAIVRPSVVMILNNYCAQVKYAESAGPLLAGKTYPFCLAQAGSGFFVNQNGYIATNGHVITNIPETTLLYGVMGGLLDNLLIDYFHAFLSSQATVTVDRQMVSQKVIDAHKQKESIYQMASVVSELFKKNLITLEKPENNYFVQLGNTPLQLSKTGVAPSRDIVTANLVDIDYKLPDPVSGFTTSDVALIKVSGQSYPALPLGRIDEVGVGSELLVVGFPGLVMGNKNLLLDTSANAEPTFTSGVVSAFKQAKGDKKNLIQTDASINHGNSGGPAISSSGKVIGIATYGLETEEGTGNYNFLRDIADLKALMIKNNVPEEIGETYPIWKNGLNNYWLSYLKYAKADFEKVNSLYPNHPTVQKYLTDTIAKIDTPDDKTPKFTRDQRKLYMNLSGGVMAFSALAIIILTITSFIDNKRQRSGIILPNQPNYPPQSIKTF